MRQSHEPPCWLLFGAGGTLAALVAPALILYTGVLAPVMAERGMALLDYEAARAIIQGPLAGGTIVVAVTLLGFHAAHRIYHTACDLGARGGRGMRAACYGAAAGGGGIAASALLVMD